MHSRRRSTNWSDPAVQKQPRSLESSLRPGTRSRSGRAWRYRPGRHFALLLFEPAGADGHCVSRLDTLGRTTQRIDIKSAGRYSVEVIKVNALPTHRFLHLRWLEYAQDFRGTQMSNRMSRWGIGPQIAAAALMYAAVAGVVTRRWPDICLMRTVPFTIPALVAGILILGGVPMSVVAAKTVMMGYSKDQLVTSGISALVRHPIYSAWIVFILPD